jgi:hypothetical protein
METGRHTPRAGRDACHRSRSRPARRYLFSNSPAAVGADPGHGRGLRATPSPRWAFQKQGGRGVQFNHDVRARWQCAFGLVITLRLSNCFPQRDRRNIGTSVGDEPTCIVPSSARARIRTRDRLRGAITDSPRATSESEPGALPGIFLRVLNLFAARATNRGGGGHLSK